MAGVGEESRYKTFEDVLKMTEVIGKREREGVPLQKVLSVSDQDMAAMEGIGEAYFLEKEYEASADIFFLLVALQPDHTPYWMRLGAAEHHKGESARALEAFGVAAWNLPEDPAPHLHLAECYVAEDQMDEAVKALTLALECVGRSPSHAQVRKQAKKLRKSLLQKQGKAEENEDES